MFWICVISFLIISNPIHAFKITGVSPTSRTANVWTDTSGPNQNVHLNYTVIELFPQGTPALVSGHYDNLRSSFVINGLKSDTWYGLHMGVVYSWRNTTYSIPDHNVAFKTLADENGNSTSDASQSDPISIAAKPTDGGFEILVVNRLGDRLKTPVSARVTVSCSDDQSYGGLFLFASDKSPRQRKEFPFNRTRLPDQIVDKNSNEWAVNACTHMCWSLFVTASNNSYVLDSQCVNLTQVFMKTAHDDTLWEAEDETVRGATQSKDDHDKQPHSNADHASEKPSAKLSNESGHQTGHDTNTRKNGCEKIHAKWLMMIGITMIVIW